MSVPKILYNLKFRNVNTHKTGFFYSVEILFEMNRIAIVFSCTQSLDTPKTIFKMNLF